MLKVCERYHSHVMLCTSKYDIQLIISGLLFLKSYYSQNYSSIISV